MLSLPSIKIEHGHNNFVAKFYFVESYLESKRSFFEFQEKSTFFENYLKWGNIK